MIVGSGKKNERSGPAVFDPQGKSSDEAPADHELGQHEMDVVLWSFHPIVLKESVNESLAHAFYSGKCFPLWGLR